MISNSRFSRRAFISNMTVVGAGSALGSTKMSDIIDYNDSFVDSASNIGLSSASNTVLLKRLIPSPKQIFLNDDNEVKLDNSLKVNIELGIADAQAKAETAAIFKQYFKAEPTIQVIQKNNVSGEESYKINASDSVLTISAETYTGIRYALYTIRQLAESNNDSEKLKYYTIPETAIEDKPAILFRGFHICWFPETEAIQIEQYIRWAAYYKFNYVIIEFWGTYPFVTHPKLSWNEYKTSSDEIKRLVDIGKELGITLIPQINIFGHASGSRGGSGKHTMLDFYPEYQPLFEPDGWVWCLSNPATRKVLTDIVMETFKAFDNPPLYHIGADEAWGAAECHSCRKSNYEELILEHLTYFHDLLAKENCRMMMWHNMLISKSDPRWKGYVSNGSANAEKMLDRLPKDIIICDWQYGAPKKEETWPTMSYFKEKGFEVLACPWNNVENIKSLGKKVNDSKLSGLLCTTWHGPSMNQLLNIIMNGAQAGWSEPPYTASNGMMGMRHLRQIGWDIPIDNYKNCGIHEWQVRPDIYP